MTKEIIEEYRDIIKPYIATKLLRNNYEGLGESDKAEFERDFDEILDLAILALEQNPCNDIPTITIPVEDYIKLIEQEPRWIPVSEILPEELHAVLVYCPTTDNIYCAFLENGKWFIFYAEEQPQINEIVIAWMPLPKPYEL